MVDQKTGQPLKPFMWRLMVIATNLLNVLLSLVPALKRKGFGYPDESTSSIVGKRYLRHNDRSWLVVAIYRLVEWVDPGHSVKYIEDDEGRS
jgi:hypothetical protein